MINKLDTPDLFKECKHCRSMISRKAKRCPFCRKAQGWTLGMTIGLIFFAIFMWGIIVTAMNETKDEMSAASVTLTEKGKVVKAEYPTWSNRDCNEIAEGYFRIGYTKEQVRESYKRWGKQSYRFSHVNKTVTSYGVHEQWVFEYGLYNHLYMYFDDGVLISFQQ